MKIYKSVLISLLVSLLFAACQKVPVNGNLDGEWEVMEVYPAPPEWDRNIRLFYNFSRSVCQLTEYGGPFTLGNLVNNGETIYLNFPFINSPGAELQLKQYGIFTNPVSFNVEFEGKSRLILSNEESTVILKKF